MDKNKNQQFGDRINFERDELREDLMGLPINEFKKVGDFGCGWGFVTWSLMQEIPASECVGIDKFDPNDPPTFSEGFSRENIQNWYKQIDAKNYPDFWQGDIVSGENLPLDLDLIYCKRVMHNIFSNKGEDELARAIKHIAQALMPNGWFCLIEIRESYFKTILEETLIQAKFEFSSPRCCYRPYQTLLKKFANYPYWIYQCKKAKLYEI
jgi:SAM-dependent methyltransferase